MSTAEQYFVLDEPIVPGIFSRCERHLMQAQEAECAGVHLFVDSAWGDYREALRIYTLIESLTMPVATSCSKRAMGAGFVVFIAGRKREASPEAKFMIESTGRNAVSPAGTVTPFPDNYQILQLLQDRGISMSTKELDQFHAGKNLHYSALEALACGIVHDLASAAATYPVARAV